MLACRLGGVDLKAMRCGEFRDFFENPRGDGLAVAGEGEVVGIAGIDKGGAATAEDTALGGQRLA